MLTIIRKDREENKHMPEKEILWKTEEVWMENKCIQNTRSSTPAADLLSGGRGPERTATVEDSLSAPDLLRLHLED